MPKSEHQASEVVISSEQIKQLAERHKLDVPDFPAFEASIRIDFEVFQRDRTALNANQHHDEIDRLYKAANRRKIAAVAAALLNLSNESIGSLSERGGRIGVVLPTAAQFAEAAEPLQLCKNIVHLCRTGGKWHPEEDSTDATPRRWVTKLHAPKKQRNLAKRAAEKAFFINLQLTWLKSTGQTPAVTANHLHHGPFVRLAEECLAMAGVKHVDVVETLNSLNGDRKDRKEIGSKRMLKTP